MQVLQRTICHISKEYFASFDYSFQMNNWEFFSEQFPFVQQTEHAIYPVEFSRLLPLYVTL